MIILDFTTLVRNQVTAIQALANDMVDFAIGSILRAVVESNSTLVIYLSDLILQLLVTTRAATCEGADLDTWMADYMVTRIGAAPATGYVTFSRFTPTQAASIPVGATVETADGSQSYMVTIDTTNPNYDAIQGAYTLAAGVASAMVPVTSTTAGVSGNAVIGGINTITQTLVGIDTVTNLAALTNGVDAESDDALRTRFVAYIASLSKATKGSIAYAITSLQSGIQYTLVENKNYDGTDNKGYFYVVVDDSTGSPTPTLLDNVGSAIDAVRPLCSTFGVFAPVVVQADVNMVLTLAEGVDEVTIRTNVKNSITNYINSLGLGATLPYTVLPRVAYDTDPGVVNVSGITLNGSVLDMVATPLETIKANNIVVN